MSLRENVHLSDHAILNRAPGKVKQDGEGHKKQYEKAPPAVKLCRHCGRRCYRDDSYARELCDHCWRAMDQDARVLWWEYALAKDSELTADALALKRKLLAGK